MPSRPSISRLALLLLGSGFCALVYQVAWLRLLRLIFGSSTLATAAVVAIFMAGLGLGSRILGPSVDRKRNPLWFYAQLELGIAVAAGLSPFLIWLVRWLYLTAGGSVGLGPVPGMILRLVLATAVLGLPTFLMGGTLPAICRAAERTDDRGRRLLGLLYGVNTLGAVIGALVTTFLSIELLGIRQTIWLAALINLLVALFARQWAREAKPQEADALAAEPVEPAPDPVAHDAPPPFRFVMFAAGVVGFAFFLMELVWYRMLAPLLGGSSYTFGLILAMALLGIGAGGLLYGAGSRARRPTLLAFAGTCSLEALLMIVPFSLGDRLAVLAGLLRDLSAFGFDGLALSWMAITALVVLPPALIAGYQFPLLVAILGAGARRVGREVGHTYAANTAGAIVGSLAGGFGLIPLLGALGAWRLVVVLLVLLAGLAVVLDARRCGWRPAVAPVAIAAAALALCSSVGPTAFWRHSPIGAGRLNLEFDDPNQLRSFLHYKNRIVRWEADGRESSVALVAADGISLQVNGKSDGHARRDAPTQVMAGLLPATLYPDPRTALVIGLGTGSTAGWLAEVATVERVDVVELEPAVVEVAAACEPVNQGALSHPKVRLIIGDGREVLMTTPERYDLVVSEPSNPYRAGVASLFTREFYEAVSSRLREGGVFAQWLQGYEVDPQVVRTAMATLGSVFGSVESWQVHRGDLLLVASHHPPDHDLRRLAALVEQEPFRSALNQAWGVDGIEGLYAGFVAPSSFTEAVKAAEGNWINTDDRPIIEFGFARSVGRKGLFGIEELRSLAARLGQDRPVGLAPAELDWGRVRELRAARSVAMGGLPEIPSGLEPATAARFEARRQYGLGELAAACRLWLSQEEPPSTPIDVVLVAECLAEGGDDRVTGLVEQLAELDRPIEAEAAQARWHARNQRWQEAGAHAVAAFSGARDRAWLHPPVLERLASLAVEIARADARSGRRIFDSIESPLAVYLLEERRLELRFDLARTIDFDGLCGDAVEQFEPHVPWTRPFLTARWRCYQQLGHPLAATAGADLQRFLDSAPVPLDRGLGPAGSGEPGG